MGSSICVSQICTCPQAMIPMGGVCSMAVGSGFGGFGGFNGFSGFGGMIYPGSPCSFGATCGGGSYCYSGTCVFEFAYSVWTISISRYLIGYCSCPAGYVLSVQQCVQQTTSISFGIQSVGGCPTGYMLIATSCVSTTYVSQLGYGYGCSSGLPCQGGSFCSAGELSHWLI